MLPAQILGILSLSFRVFFPSPIQLLKLRKSWTLLPATILPVFSLCTYLCLGPVYTSLQVKWHWAHESFISFLVRSYKRNVIEFLSKSHSVKRPFRFTSIDKSEGGGWERERKRISCQLKGPFCHTLYLPYYCTVRTSTSASYFRKKYHKIKKWPIIFPEKGKQTYLALHKDALLCQ